MFKIVYTTQAMKVLHKMPHHMALLIQEKIAQVALDPYAAIPNAKKLQGSSGYRLRVGDWRVIYEIKNKEVVIIVLKVGLRSEVYK